MSEFETFVNLELPRRAAFLTVAITGWDGDPNDPGAPAILTGAPLGTEYKQETPEKLWKKGLGGVWSELGGAVDLTSVTTDLIPSDELIDVPGTPAEFFIIPVPANPWSGSLTLEVDGGAPTVVAFSLGAGAEPYSEAAVQNVIAEQIRLAGLDTQISIEVYYDSFFKARIFGLQNGGSIKLAAKSFSWAGDTYRDSACTVVLAAGETASGTAGVDQGSVIGVQEAQARAVIGLGSGIVGVIYDFDLSVDGEAPVTLQYISTADEINEWNAVLVAAGLGDRVVFQAPYGAGSGLAHRVPGGTLQITADRSYGPGASRGSYVFGTGVGVEVAGVSLDDYRRWQISQDLIPAKAGLILGGPAKTQIDPKVHLLTFAADWSTCSLTNYSFLVNDQPFDLELLPGHGFTTSAQVAAHFQAQIVAQGLDAVIEALDCDASPPPGYLIAVSVGFFSGQLSGQILSKTSKNAPSDHLNCWFQDRVSDSIQDLSEYTGFIDSRRAEPRRAWGGIELAAIAADKASFIAPSTDPLGQEGSFTLDDVDSWGGLTVGGYYVEAGGTVVFDRTSNPWYLSPFLSGSAYVETGAFGYVKSDGGGVCMGAVEAEGAAASATSEATGWGATCFGSAWAWDASGIALTQAWGGGVFVCGSANAGDNCSAQIKGAAGGTFAGGYIDAYTYGSGEIVADWWGAFSWGYVFSDGTVAPNQGTVHGYGAGSFAQGAVFAQDGVNAGVLALSDGCKATGVATKAVIQAGVAPGDSNGGANAGGWADEYDILATGPGSFAWGWTDTGAIEALAANAWQWGPGTNSEPNSLQIGNGGLHFKATDGAFVTPHDGAHWMDSGVVNFQSNGVPVTFNQPSVTGSRGGNAALADLLTQLAGMGLIVDNTSA